MNPFIKRLCSIGIHWSGAKNLGMYGDASRCSRCGKDAYGLRVLHEDPPTFVEPGTGLRMKRNLWYILSDSGSLYSQEGYGTPTEARLWVLNAKQYGLTEDEVTEHWTASGNDPMPEPNLCNIVKAESLRDFWLANDREYYWSFQ